MPKKIFTAPAPFLVTLADRIQTLGHKAELGAPDPDTELSARWREGAYPYRHLLSRRSYLANVTEGAGGLDISFDLYGYLKSAPGGSRG